ncbi:hypothetical protein [Bacillus sp. 1P06AnD]|uniref:hypothetical protein n=1 Tax=Bacillus sp. 1P06AnD TaxID=3132208 RepID=UPI0039A3C3E8
MEKTIVIDGKNVSFKSTGASALRYKAQFNRDFFADVSKLAALEKLIKSKEAENNPEIIEKIDFTFFYNIAWVFAKTADKEIKDQMDWLDSFDSFPIMDIIPELKDLIAITLQSKKK